jgi:exonuclease III
MPAVRVITWNVAGRVRRQPEQAELIAASGADVVALQEVSPRTLPRWREALAAAGFADCPSALDDAPRCGVGGVEVVNLHSPISPAPDLAKVRTHEAVAAYLTARDAQPVVLCGDLNTPRRELPDGDVLTFAHDSAGRLRPERGERWDRAERALVHGLRECGWVDAFRALHGYGERHASWTFANDRGGWRLDHVIVRGLRPVAAAYAHDWRRAGLSDHSPLVVDLVR